MSKKINILWIDDRPDRERDICGVEPDFRSVRNVNLQSEIISIKAEYDKKRKVPDLIILDQVLDKIDRKPEGSELFTSGASVSLMLREFWGNTPIIGITAVQKLGHITQSKKDVFDDFIDGNELTKYEDKLLVIAKTFYSKRNLSLQTKAEVNSLLKAPRNISEQLSQILPCDLLKNDGKQFFRLFKWINSLLFVRPGFLYDRFWMATYLGLTRDGFGKVESIFSSAKYKGVFANNKDECWWSIKAKEVLSKQVKDTSIFYPWEMGRKLPKIKRKHYSKCHKCNAEYPEIVAYTDSTKKKKAAMHVSCTEELKEYDKMLFFEDLRAMKDD